MKWTFIFHSPRMPRWKKLWPVDTILESGCLVNAAGGEGLSILAFLCMLRPVSQHAAEYYHKDYFPASLFSWSFFGQNSL